MGIHDYDDLAAALAAHFEKSDGEAPKEPNDPRPVTRGSEFQDNPQNAQKIGKPTSEGGLPSPAPQEENTDVSCAFDWYQATIYPHLDGTENRATPAVICFSFIQEFGGTWEESRGRNGYEEGRTHSSGVELWWGGQNHHPHLKSSSARSHDVATWLRREYPNHGVSRADVALDFLIPEGRGFDILHALIEPLARKARVKCEFQGDLAENDPDYDPNHRDGRTHYYGSKSSEARLVLYEKGLEQRGKGNKDADPNWVRIEVRLRPSKARKRQAAALEPFDIIGFSKWISGAVGATLDQAPSPIPNPDKKEKPVEHSLEQMARQYGGRMREFIEKHGWQEFDLFLYRTLYTQKERAKMEQDKVIAPPLRRQAERPTHPVSPEALIERDLIKQDQSSRRRH